MKIGDSVSNHYRIRIGSSDPGNALAVGTDPGGQRSQAPTVSIRGSASASSLTSMLWQSLADKLESGSINEPLTTGVADEFMEWAEMSLAEKIQAQILKEKGLTQEDLATMDADQRAAIVQEIEEAIKRQLELEDAQRRTSSAVTG